MRTIRLILAVLLLTTVLAGCQKSTAAPSTSLRGRYAAPREFQVLATDVSLHARVAGDSGSGCVLIAINGGPGLTSNYMWDLERLAGPDCAVVTYDQRGLGKSTRPMDPESTASYTLQKYAKDVEAIRQAVGAERLHVMGHSWGGIVAMEYAILYPEHVASLIFFGGGPPTWKDIEIAKLSFYQRVERLIQSGVIPPQSEWADDGSDPMLPANFSDPAFTFPEDSLGGPPEFSQVVSDLTSKCPSYCCMAGTTPWACQWQKLLVMHSRMPRSTLWSSMAAATSGTNARMTFTHGSKSFLARPGWSKSDDRHLATLEIACLASGHFAPLAGVRRRRTLYTGGRLRKTRRPHGEVQHEASGTNGRDRLDCRRSSGRSPRHVPPCAGAAAASTAPTARAPSRGRSCPATALRAPGMEGALLVRRRA
jgi:pimeloyl-ACP methyl ester carboxylesterase